MFAHPWLAPTSLVWCSLDSVLEYYASQPVWNIPPVEHAHIRSCSFILYESSSIYYESISIAYESTAVALGPYEVFDGH
jgi:hypothetical protein